jgi:hypothetical protein
MNIKLDLSKIDNIQVAGVDTKDYPNFCDSFIESADYDGRAMTEEELDELNSKYSDFVYEKVIQSLY